MVTPKKIIMKDLELADEEIVRLRKENKELKNELMEDMKYEEKLEKENKELKEEVKKRKMVADENGTGYDMLERENKELKEMIAEYDDLTEELDYRKREAKRLGWNNMNNKQEIHF